MLLLEKAFINDTGYPDKKNRKLVCNNQIKKLKSLTYKRKKEFDQEKWKTVYKGTAEKRRWREMENIPTGCGIWKEK